MAGSMRRRTTAVETDDQKVEREIAEFLAKHVTCAMFNRMGELNRQLVRWPQGSPQRKELERRVHRLDAYLEPPYQKPKAAQDRLILNFARSLIDGTFRKKGRQINTWEEVKQLTDAFVEQVRTRPPGHPVSYRPRVLEALEIKHANPGLTWAKIHSDLKLPITMEDFKRQIGLLRKLLKDEGIRA